MYLKRNISLGVELRKTASSVLLKCLGQVRVLPPCAESQSPLHGGMPLFIANTEVHGRYPSLQNILVPKWYQIFQGCSMKRRRLFLRPAGDLSILGKYTTPVEKKNSGASSAATIAGNRSHTPCHRFTRKISRRYFSMIICISF